MSEHMLEISELFTVQQNKSMKKEGNRKQAA